MPNTFTTREEARKIQGKLHTALSEAIGLHGTESAEYRAVREELKSLEDAAIALYAKPEVPDCKECARYSVFGGPSHHASRMCRSGGRPHCTCSACW